MRTVCGEQGGIPISIHALREEGDRSESGRSKSARPISIHALREEGDSEPSTMPAATDGFLSTPSARRATIVHGCKIAAFLISIHALREEGDVWTLRP